MSDPLATAADVQALGTFEITDFDPFIETAHAIVDTFLSTTTIPVAMLTQIEIYLAAHFATLRDPRVKQVAIHSGNVTYMAPNMGQGLLASIYGQQALALDYTNTLFSLGRSKATARMV